MEMDRASMGIRELIGATEGCLKELYFSDSRPWVIAYSGGKDSTALLQLVYRMLLNLGDKPKKPVIVLSSDTQVEPPNVAAYLHKSLSKIQNDADERGLPITAKIVRPLPSEGFWGKLIGRGYPPPSRWFRWCTSNMKIRPSRRAIDDITRIHGSVILLLGTRVAESSQRAKSMKSRDKNSRGLNPHHEIPNALVSTPIALWSTDDVWEYLHVNECPWGHDHSFLISLYKQANSGECPLIVDLSTPSCGGSRFGCWTCTVVKEDKSMKGFINSGEEHLQPLAEFRNWLIVLRDKPGCRSNIKRNGHAGPGPFLASTRQEILERLLMMEREMRYQLISDEELIYIQEEWSKEYDYENKLAKQIASKYGRDFMPISRINPVNSIPEEDLLEKIAVENDINPVLLRELLDLKKNDYPTLDKWGAKTAFQKAIASLIEKAAKQAEQAIES